MRNLLIILISFASSALHADDERNKIAEKFANIYSAVLERHEDVSEFGVDAIFLGRLRQESLKQLNSCADWKRLKHGQRALVFETVGNKIHTIIYVQEGKSFTLNIAGEEHQLTMEELKSMFH